MASGDVFADQFGLADGLTQDIQPALGVSVMITQIMCSGSFGILQFNSGGSRNVGLPSLINSSGTNTITTNLEEISPSLPKQMFINNADHFSLKADGGTMYFWYSGVEL